MSSKIPAYTYQAGWSKAKKLYIGKVKVFPHIEVEGATIDEAISKLKKEVLAEVERLRKSGKKPPIEFEEDEQEE